MILLFSILWSSVFSQNKPMNSPSVDILRRQIKDLAQKTQTITSDFIQEKEMTMITEKIISFP
jgi:hypothetical protein